MNPTQKLMLAFVATSLAVVGTVEAQPQINTQVALEALRRQTASQVFDLIDTNGDGVLEREEVVAWAVEAANQGNQGQPARLVLSQPPVVTGAPVDDNPPSGGGTPPPAASTTQINFNGLNPQLLSGLLGATPCSQALIAGENSTPQATGVTCFEGEGPQFAWTICNTEGFDSRLLTLPQGQNASCFSVAQSRGNVVWGIRTEEGMQIYDSNDGPEVLAGRLLTSASPSTSGRYIFWLNRNASDPGSYLRINFVQYQAQ